MLYLQFLCTDYVSDENFRRNFAGNLMIFVFSINILVNASAGVWTMLEPTIKKIKRWLFRRKNKKIAQAFANTCNPTSNQTKSETDKFSHKNSNLSEANL
jgi:hypothetical protein